MKRFLLRLKPVLTVFTRNITLYSLGIIVLFLIITLFVLSLDRPYMGIDIRLEDQTWKVNSVDPSGLAQATGIKSGDIVTSVNGEDPAEFAVTADRLPLTGIETLSVTDAGGTTIFVSTYDSPIPRSTIIESMCFLFIGLVFWVIGGWVLLKKPNMKAARRLYLLSLAVCVIFIGTTAYTRDILGTRHIQVATIALLVPLFLHLCLIFPKPKKFEINSRDISGIIYLPALIILTLYGLMGNEMEAYYSWYRPLQNAYAAIGFFMGIGILVHSYFTATCDRMKQQSKIIMSGALIGILPIVLLSIIPDCLTSNIWVAPQFAALTVIFIPISMSYSIVRHQLLDINIYLSRILVYGVILLALIASYILLTIGLTETMGSLSEIQRISIIIALSCLFIVLSPLVKTKVQRQLNQIFYKDIGGYRQSMGSISATLSSTTDIDTLSNFVVSSISNTLGLSGVCLFIRDQTGKWQLGQSSGIYDNWENLHELPQQIESLNEIDKFPGKAPEYLGVEFVVPLKSGDREIGVLCLGRKSSQSDFSADDISFVYTLAMQAATTIENAILFEKAKEDSIKLKTLHYQLEKHITSLGRSKAQLRDLAARTESVREAERMRLSREIHDELGQQLTVLKMETAWLYKKLPEKQKTLLARINSMMDLIDNTIKSVRRISSELRPGVLDDLGVGVAIEWQAKEFQERTNIKCRVDVESDSMSVNQDIATTIFRIFQEALTNVARHSDATLVDITLKRKSDDLELKVRDNGKGITKEQISDTKSLGLLGMQERAWSQGGELRINGLPGRGTTITLIIPLHWKEEA